MKVVEVRSPHSYIIELDEVRQHVHANKLRRFLVASDSVVCRPDFEAFCTVNVVSPLDSSVDNVEVCDNFNFCLSNGCAVVSDSCNGLSLCLSE